MLKRKGKRWLTWEKEKGGEDKDGGDGVELNWGDGVDCDAPPPEKLLFPLLQMFHVVCLGKGTHAAQETFPFLLVYYYSL